MNSEMFNKGLSKRRKVLGDEYVDKALATADGIWCRSSKTNY